MKVCRARGRAATLISAAAIVVVELALAPATWQPVRGAVLLSAVIAPLAARCSTLDPLVTPRIVPPAPSPRPREEVRGLVDINTVLDGALGAGTGIVLKLNGSDEVITNNHVIEGATRIAVTDVRDGQPHLASVISQDRAHDLAVLSVPHAPDLPPAVIGDSDDVRVGDHLRSVGNAGGKGGAPDVADGTVTALDQSVVAENEFTGQRHRLSGLIQVDSNIQPGDSGGPLIDDRGQVVGIDTAAASSPANTADVDIADESGTPGHLGYAIPINEALSYAERNDTGTDPDPDLDDDQDGRDDQDGPRVLAAPELDRYDGRATDYHDGPLRRPYGLPTGNKLIGPHTVHPLSPSLKAKKAAATRPALRPLHHFTSARRGHHSAAGHHLIRPRP